MEVIKNDQETKIIFETDEEKLKLPIFLCKVQELLRYGWGGVRITVQTKTNGSKHIHIRHWEDEQ
jgi:hypothetical protein